ncbi:MAG: hypothetical protein Q7S86_05450 [bacterium]|nr:hypothetical protein [bacterium]
MKDTFSPLVWAAVVFWVSFNYAYYFAPVFAMFLLFCFGLALRYYFRPIVLAVQWGGVLGVSCGHTLLFYPWLECFMSQSHLLLFSVGVFSFSTFFAGGLFNFGLRVGKDFESSKNSGGVM